MLKSIAPMNQSRYSIPVCTLRDNFVFAVGGVTSLGGGAKKFTNACEIFDIQKNQWISVHPMEKPRA